MGLIRPIGLIGPFAGATFVSAKLLLFCEMCNRGLKDFLR